MKHLGHFCQHPLAGPAGVSLGQKFRREQLVERGHIDTVKTRRDNRRAGYANVNFLCSASLANVLHQRPQGRRADDGIFHQENPLARHDAGQGRVLVAD